jgi:hypothetical protein
MAGFGVATNGRFWGGHRGQHTFGLIAKIVSEKDRRLYLTGVTKDARAQHSEGWHVGMIKEFASIIPDRRPNELGCDSLAIVFNGR